MNCLQPLSVAYAENSSGSSVTHQAFDITQVHVMGLGIPDDSSSRCHVGRICEGSHGDSDPHFATPAVLLILQPSLSQLHPKSLLTLTGFTVPFAPLRVARVEFMGGGS